MTGLWKEMKSTKRWVISVLVGILLALAGNFYVQSANGNLHEEDIHRIANEVADRMK